MPGICATETFRPDMTARNPGTGAKATDDRRSNAQLNSPAASANETYNQQERRRSNRQLND